LVFSPNPNAIMESVCAIKKAAGLSVFTVYEDTDGDNEYIAELPRGEDIQFNVVAVVEKDQVAVPYNPVTLRIPDRQAYGGRLFLSILVLAVIIFGFIALYFYFKGKRLQQMLAEEVRDVGDN